MGSIAWQCLYLQIDHQACNLSFVNKTTHLQYIQGPNQDTQNVFHM